MSLLGGLLKIYAFAAIWGALSGVNLALCKIATGYGPSFITVSLSLIVGFVEVLLIGHWYEITHREKPSPTPDLAETKHNIDA